LMGKLPPALDAFVVSGLNDSPLIDRLAAA
jgi:hypothetical protein